MTQMITQAATEVTKSAIMVVRKANNPVNNARAKHTMARSGGPVYAKPCLAGRHPTNIRNSATTR